MLTGTRLGPYEARRLVAAESQAQYVDPGYLLFMRQGTLYAQKFDARRLALEGGVLTRPGTEYPGTW